MRVVPRRLLRLLAGDTARQGYLAGVDQGLISVTNFLASIVLARGLTPTQFGAYGVGFLLLHFARSVQDGLVVQPMTALAPSMQGADRRRYFTGSGIEQGALALVGAAGCAGLGAMLTIAGNPIAGPTLFALWFPVLFAQSQEFVRRVFYTEERVILAVVTTAVASVVRLGATVWALNAGGQEGTVGLYAIGWGGIAGLILGLVLARGSWERIGLNLVAIFRRNWAIGRWVVGGTVTNWFTIDAYPILTAGLVSFAAAGAYRAVQTVVAPIPALLRAMDTYFTPRLADRRRSAGGRGVNHLVGRMYLVTGPPIVGFLLLAVFFAEPIMTFLFGSTYSAYANAARGMALFYLASFSYWPLQSALKALERARPIFIGSVLAIVSMFTVGVWAILTWGVYGTIAGQTLSAVIVSVVLWRAWLRWKRSESPRTS
jgi:O-antigen/teichoic acid export membrane protein